MPPDQRHLVRFAALSGAVLLFGCTWLLALARHSMPSAPVLWALLLPLLSFYASSGGMPRRAMAALGVAIVALAVVARSAGVIDVASVGLAGAFGAAAIVLGGRLALPRPVLPTPLAGTGGARRSQSAAARRHQRRRAARPRS